MNDEQSTGVDFGIQFEPMEVAPPVTLDSFREGVRGWSRVTYDGAGGIPTSVIGPTTMVHMSEQVIGFSILMPVARMEHLGVDTSVYGTPAPECREVLVPWDRLVCVEAMTEHDALVTLATGMGSPLALESVRAIATRMLERGL